jgi:dTDP-4-dehydrorhamnose reductase
VEFVRQAIAAGRISADRPPRLEAIDETLLQRPAPRPRWSPLDPGLYERTFARTMPHWRDAIGAVLRNGTV